MIIDPELVRAAAMAVAPPASAAKVLAQHLASEHALIAAIDCSHEANAGAHWRAHTDLGASPGHHITSFAFDPVRADLYAVEAAAGWPHRYYNIRWFDQTGFAVRVAEDNYPTLVAWLSVFGVSATWDHEPPRLSFGGRLGSFCIPPGWWAVTRA